MSSGEVMSNSLDASAWLDLGIAATPDGSEVSSDHSEGVPYSDTMISDAITLAAGMSAHSCSTSLAGITTGDEASVYSVGSKAHSAGRCKPCAFFHKQGCQNGSECLFCHRCPPHEKQRRKRVRRKMIRDRVMRSQATQYGANATAGSAADWNCTQGWMREMPPASTAVPAPLQLPDVGPGAAMRVHWGMPVMRYAPSAVHPIDESGAASPSRATACQVWESPSPTTGHGQVDQGIVQGGGWTIAAPYQPSVLPAPFPVPEFTTNGRYAPDSPTASEHGGMGYQTIQYALVPLPMPAVQQQQMQQHRPLDRGFPDGVISPTSCTPHVSDLCDAYRGDWAWGVNEYHELPPATNYATSPHGDDFCQNAPIEVPAC